jgi:predicted GIY-YIG superfamily endonuclease
LHTTGRSSQISRPSSRDDVSVIVYVLESESNPQRHYTGICSDLPTRLRLHNNGLSAHTAKYRPWRVLVSLKFSDQATAVRFERYLKSGSGRAFAKRHFAGEN